MKALLILLALLGTQEPEVEPFRGITAPPLPEGVSSRELVSRFVQSDWLTVRQAEKARAWWRSQGKRWTRLAALKSALDSGDPKRQVKALSWLRYGTTRCDGLSRELFARDLKPKVQKLAQSTDPSVRQQAELLAEDTGMWWAYKTDPTLRDW